MSGLLSIDDIIAAQDREHIDVDVPEWGGKVRIAAMSSKSMDSYDAWLVSVQGKTQELAHLRAMFLSYCIVDEDGELMFSGDKLEALNAKNGQVIQRLWEEARKFNRVGIEGIEDAAGN